MKKFFLGALAIAGLVACVQEDVLNTPDLRNEIGFGGYVNGSVRSVANPSTTTNTIEHFTVWSYMDDKAGLILENELVEKSGDVWTYANTQYWLAEHQYHFYAITPYGNGKDSHVTIANGANYDCYADYLGTIEFENVDGTEDVLYATADESTVGNSIPESVQFAFDHLLSKVKFTFVNGFTTSNIDIAVTEVTMTAPKNATTTLGKQVHSGYEWTGHTGETVLDFGNIAAGDRIHSLSSGASDNERLTFPAKVDDNLTYTVKFKVAQYVGTQTTPAATYDLESTVTGVEFVAGKAYNFVAAITHETLDLEAIEFEVTVDEWDLPAIEERVDYFIDKANGNYVAVTAQGLSAIAEGINAGTIDSDVNITLNGNIDLNATRSASNWTPIGTAEVPYTGTFDGKDYTIKNLNIVEETAKEGKAYIGFFGYAKNATIKNVTFENVYINIPCLDIDHSQGHIGAVAGSLEGTSTIENVTVKGDIKVYATQDANGASRVAVIAGGNSYGNVTMENVHVIANEGSYLIANNNTGALAGQLQGKSVCKNCSSNINVTVNKFFAGGLIGLAAGDQLFENCHTTGNIAVVAGRSGKAHDHYRVGGIAGGWADGAKNVCTLNNCSYTGTLTGINSDGSVAEKFDYMGYVGRGYTLNGCNGSKVIVNGMAFVQTAPGLYDVTYDGEGKVVVVNDAKSLLNAVKNVADGDVITLSNSFDFSTEKGCYYDNGGWRDGLGYSGDKSFTLDLNGYTLGNTNGALNDYLVWFKNDGAKPNLITIKNGTLDAGTTAYCAIATSSSNKQTITINLENVTLYNNNTNGAVAKIRAGAVLNMKAGAKIIGKNSYTGIECVASTTNIYEGAEIYQNGTSSSWGFLAGSSWGGVINVYNGRGVSARGGFIAMTSGGTVNVHGGEWIANVDGTIGNNSNLYVLSAQNNKYESGYKGASIINVTGGTFRGGMDAWILNQNLGEQAELNISGGNFNANPKHYLAEGYAAVESNGIWNVIEAATVSTPEALAAAVANGGYVVLAEDVALADAITVEGATATIDLNGKTLTAAETDGVVAKAGATVTISGNGKVISNGSPIRAIGGTVVVEGGEFTQTGAFNTAISTYRYSVDSREGGKIIINGGEFKSNNGMINVSEGAELEINGGNFLFDNNTKGTRHFAVVSGNITVNDGVFKGIADGSAGGCFFCGWGGTVTVNGGKFTSLWTSGSKNNIWESYYGGSIEVKGGIFNHNGGIKAQVTENTDAATKDAYPYMAK